MSGYDYSVAILGSGIAGSTLANILARHGHSVVLVDSGSHPRFALGESTIGETSYLLKLLSARFDVPELGHLSSFEGVRQHVSSACGVKRNFGFVYHREGQTQNPEEVTQCNVSEFPNGPEMHMHRQDIDSYLFYTAVRYGAAPRQRAVVERVDFADDGAVVVLRTGENLRVRYVVDASGRNSVLAGQFGLREDPCRFRTNSRTLFTHMVGVPPFDDVTVPSGQPSPWHKGTLHHLFDGGWMWVIPFDNHERATNPLCSVGLSLDTRRYPKQPGVSAEQEWSDFLDRFPSIRSQFAGARPAWDWVSTGRTQYGSTRTVGDRWAMMSHAAGAIDALFSRGMANTMQVIYAFAPLLMNALDGDGDFSAERFATIDTLNQTILDFNDTLVHGSYVSFRDFDLWRAWSKVWFLGWNMGISRIVGTYFGYLEKGDRALLERLSDAPYAGSFCPDLAEFQALYGQLHQVILDVEADQLEPADAVTRLSRLLEADFLPSPLRLSDVLRRWHDGSFEAQRQMYEWGRNAAPTPLRRWYDYDFDELVARTEAKSPAHAVGSATSA